MKKILIWWTNQKDCQAVGDKLPETFPDYLHTEYSYRNGRSGRGRLWSHLTGDGVSVEKWIDTPLGNVLSEYGGIVIFADDIELLKQFPGIITDTKLTRVW